MIFFLTLRAKQSHETDLPTVGHQRDDTRRVEEGSTLAPQSEQHRRSACSQTRRRIINRSFFFSAILLSGLVTYPLRWLTTLGQIEGEDWWPIVSLSSLPFSLFALVVLCVFLHRVWHAVQPFGVRTTPGKAVLFCFIPLFNLYWVFQAFYGHSKDFNSIIRAKHPSLPIAPKRAGLLLAILCVVGIIPFSKLVLAPFALCACLVFIWKTSNCVNALADLSADKPKRDPCQAAWPRQEWQEPAHRDTYRPMCFGALGWRLLLVLGAAYVPLSLWGGSQHWVGPTGLLPFIMLGIGVAYVLFESVRLASPGIVPVLAAVVAVLIIGPSLLLDHRDAVALPIMIATSYMFGLTSSTVCWLIRSRRVASPVDWSMWLGIHGLVLPFLAVPAIICGHASMFELRRPGQYLKRRRVTIGLNLGYLTIAAYVLGIVLIACNA